MSAVPYSAYLKVVGAFVVVIGFVEIGVGAEVWAFLPGVRYGCWWGAMIAVAAGIVGLIANDKKTVQLVAWLSAFASILLFAGMLVDSLGFRRVNDLQTCVNGDTNEVYGASGYQPEAAVCAAGTNRLCGCVGHVNNFACHTYDINHYRQQNCGLILTRYTDLLLVSLVFDTFTLAWVFTLSVMSCASYSAIVAAENPSSAAASPKKAASETELVTAPAATESPAKSAVAKTEDDAPDAANKV